MATTTDEPLPLQELMERILAPEPSFQKPKGLLAGLGTMQALNQRLANQPLLDFIRKLGRNPVLLGRLYITIYLVNDPPETMDQTAYTSEVQLCAGGEAKSVDREKRTGQW
jgi:hypothetical protein